MRNNLMIAMITITLAAMTQAETTAKGELERLKTNSENSVANVHAYEKNLQIVNTNIAEVLKAKSQVDAQVKEVQGSVKVNQTSMQALDKQEQDINKLIQGEDKELLAEQQKVKELELAIATLKANQDKRTKNVLDYKTQLTQIASERQAWKARQDKVGAQQKDVSDRLAAVKKTEKDWVNKKRGYEGEISRWQKESDKHQKLLEQYTALADHKE